MVIIFPNGLTAAETAVLTYNGHDLVHVASGHTAPLLLRTMPVADLTRVDYAEAKAEMIGLIADAPAVIGRSDVFALDPDVQAAWAQRARPAA